MSQQDDVIRSKEMTVEQLELALSLLNQAYLNQRPLSDLVLPSQLKHLSPLDWEIVDNLYVTLENEKRWSRVH